MVRTPAEGGGVGRSSTWLDTPRPDVKAGPGWRRDDSTGMPEVEGSAGATDQVIDVTLVIRASSAQIRPAIRALHAVRVGRIAHSRSPRWADRSSRPPKAPQQRRSQSRCWTIRAKSSASRLAPPTRAPSMSGWPISSLALPGFTEPPYWIRTDSAASAPKAEATTWLTSAHTACASSPLDLRTLPLAHNDPKAD